MAATDVPEHFSQRRAAFLSGLSRARLAQHIEDGIIPANERGQISREDLEAFLGFRITAQRWDDATIAISRSHMTGASA
jgi:hypothetical protein